MFGVALGLLSDKLNINPTKRQMQFGVALGLLSDKLSSHPQPLRRQFGVALGLLSDKLKPRYVADLLGSGLLSGSYQINL